MKHSLRKTLAAGALALIACSASWAAGPLPQSGKGMTIYFDVGGAVGESYATVVQNGAAQAAADMGVARRHRGPARVVHGGCSKLVGLVHRHVHGVFLSVL